MTTKFIIADPGLCKVNGHNYTLAVSLSAAARDMGFEVLWLCGCRLPKDVVPDGVRAEPIFPASYYKFKVGDRRHRKVEWFNGLMDRFGSRPMHQAWWRRLRIYPFERELSAALARCGAGPGDHLLITTAEYLQYQSLLNLLESVPPERLPFIHLRTFYDEHHERNGMFGPRLPVLFRRYRQLGVVDRRVFFYAEIPELAEHFNRWGIVRFATFECPAPATPLRRHSLERKPADGQPLTILFPGDPRLEKGFDRLPAIVARLLARKDLAHPVRFVVQGSAKRTGKQVRRAAPFREQLLRFPSDRVTLLNGGTPTSEAFYRTLAEADIVLLPYHADRYRNRPSMIAVEAALFGKPLVVSAGVPVAAHAQDGCGAVAASDEEFAARLAQVINDYDAYHARALARGAHLYEQYDGRSLIRRMVERTQALSGSDWRRKRYDAAISREKNDGITSAAFGS